MERAAGYEPADEGSSPSLNTISSRRLRVIIIKINQPLDRKLARLKFSINLWESNSTDRVPVF